MLFTKSIQDKKLKKDGIRICIMRRVRPEFEFNMWIPNLAPSTQLLQDYHDKKIGWDKFTKRYSKEVFGKQSLYLNLVADLAKKQDITILCWEKKGENCHRLLVSGKIKELNPKLRIEHR